MTGQKTPRVNFGKCEQDSGQREDGVDAILEEGDSTDQAMWMALNGTFREVVIYPSTQTRWWGLRCREMVMMPEVETGWNE